MTITVIEQTTAERKAETRKIFQEIQPYLDKGYSFGKALKKAKGIEINNRKNGWVRDLIEYSRTQGYDYYEYKWRRPGKDNNI